MNKNTRSLELLFSIDSKIIIIHFLQLREKKRVLNDCFA